MQTKPLFYAKEKAGAKIFCVAKRYDHCALWQLCGRMLGGVEKRQAANLKSSFAYNLREKSIQPMFSPLIAQHYSRLTPTLSAAKRAGGVEMKMPVANGH